MICHCGRNELKPGQSECYRCSKLGVGFRFRGGALTSSDGFHMTKQDWLREHLNVDYEKQLVKERPDIARF